MDEKLEKLIKAALARGPMSKEELEAQRRSWVRGEAGLGSDADEAAHRAAYEAGDKKALQRLQIEAEARMKLADKYLESH